MTTQLTCERKKYVKVVYSSSLAVKVRWSSFDPRPSSPCPWENAQKNLPCEQPIAMIAATSSMKLPHTLGKASPETLRAFV
jgi:hypothetical protein